MTSTPSIVEAFRIATEREIARIMGPIPGKILAWNATTQRATVQPLIKVAKLDEGGSRVVEARPPVTNVPVVFPGGGTYRITWPVSVGDYVMLVPAGVAIDRWLVRGGMVDPEDNRAHDIDDSVAYTGLYDFNHLPTTAPVDAMVVHAAALRLGSDGANDPVVRKSDLVVVINALNALITLYNAHTHATLGTPPAPPASSSATPTCSTSVWSD